MKDKKLLSLTNSQKNIWDTELYFSNSNLNNIGGYVFIEEDVDLKKLEKAINLYVAKNDALRFHIISQENELYPKQKIQKHKNFSLEVEYVDSIEKVEKNSTKFVRTPFVLEDSNLFNFKMFKMPNNQGGFYVVLHHLISDAWNMSLMISEIMDFYSNESLQSLSKENFTAANYKESAFYKLMCEKND